MLVADVIALIESSNNQTVQRFEPLQYKASNPALRARVASLNACSLATADVYCAMSHGLYQIMGFNLYGKGLNYGGTIFKFLSDPIDQRAMFNRYLQLDNLDKVTIEQLKLDAPRANFAKLYNGPGNVADYSAKILAAITQLEKTQ